MESPNQIFTSPTKVQKILHSKDNNYLIIVNNEGLNIIDNQNKNLLSVLPKNDWSDEFLPVYNNKMNGIFCFSINHMAIELYKKAKNSTVSGVQFRTKAKKFTLDRKIARIEDDRKVFFDDLKSYFDLDQLLMVESDYSFSEDFSSVTSDSSNYNILLQKTCSKLKINLKDCLTTNQLIRDKYFCLYQNQSQKLILIDIDFGKITFSEKIDEKIDNLLVDDENIIYSSFDTGMNKYSVKSRKLLEQPNSSLARLLVSCKNSSSLESKSEDPLTSLFNQINKTLLSETNPTAFRKILLGPFKSTDTSKFKKFLQKENLTILINLIRQMFNFLDQLNYFTDSLFFEETVFLINLIIDSKMNDLLVQKSKNKKNTVGNDANIEQLQFFKLKIREHNKKIERLKECTEIMGVLLEKQEELKRSEKMGGGKFGGVPEPWDQYAVQIVQFP